MARGTIMFDFLLLLTVSSLLLSANAKHPSMLDRARKLIDINGFDMSSLMGGLQNSDGGDSEGESSPDLDEVAKNAPGLMAMAGIQSPDGANAPGIEEDVAKNAPAILAGLQSLQQDNAEPPSDDNANLFEGLDNFRDNLNNKKAAVSPAAAPIPAKGQQATLAPSPQVSKSAQSPSQSAQSPGQSAQSPSQLAAGPVRSASQSTAGPVRSTIAMGPTFKSGRAAFAPSSGNGHIAVSPASSSVDKDSDDTAKAPSSGKGY